MKVLEFEKRKDVIEDYLERLAKQGADAMALRNHLLERIEYYHGKKANAVSEDAKMEQDMILLELGIILLRFIGEIPEAILEIYEQFGIGI